MSVPSPALVGMNGSRQAWAWSRQMSVCSLYSSISISPAWAARRKWGASPRPSKLMRPETTLRTQPAATSQSTGMPATIATSVRSRLPWRAISRTTAIGALFIDSPPMPTVAPSGMSSTASARVRRLSTGGSP